MGNTNGGLKVREARVLEKVMQIVGERDEGIRSAFQQINQQAGNSFQTMDFKLNIIFTVLKSLGITQEHIDSAAEEVKAMIEANKGGDTNEQTTQGNSSEITEPTDEGSEDLGEGGDEHFGGD